MYAVEFAGSNFLEAGWEANTTLLIMLDGEDSAFDSTGIMVMVFPYIP